MATRSVDSDLQMLPRSRWLLVLAAAGVSALVWLALLDWSMGSDVREAYFPSPEMQDGVELLASYSGSARISPLPAAVGGDFDGDGVEDRLECEYFHIEPLLRRSTSGRVLIRSGVDSTTLLARVIATPLNPVTWCGDRDGNGTDDLLVHDEGRWIVIGKKQ